MIFLAPQLIAQQLISPIVASMLPLGMRAKGPGKMTIHSALSGRIAGRVMIMADDCPPLTSPVLRTVK